MGGSISFVLSNVFCVKMEFDIFTPVTPKLYKLFVDDIYNKRIKNQPGKVFHKLNDYHPNINLTRKLYPSKFLDVEILIKNCITETYVVESKILSHWLSAVHKEYKQNAILGDLHRAHKISNNFAFEKQCTKGKSLIINSLYNFIQSTFNLIQSTFNFKLAILIKT